MRKFLYLLKQWYEDWNINDLDVDQVQEVWDKSQLLLDSDIR